MQLNEIKDNDGARKRRMRIGRGIGSGKGKTGGRGGKGQTARSGVAINGFEGGQTPIHRRLPKRGFTNINRIEYPVVNLGALQKAIESGAVDAKKTITTDSLISAGLLRPKTASYKLLGKGTFAAKATIEATFASKAAMEAVEKAGGSVVISA